MSPGICVDGKYWPAALTSPSDTAGGTVHSASSGAELVAVTANHVALAAVERDSIDGDRHAALPSRGAHSNCLGGYGGSSCAGARTRWQAGRGSGEHHHRQSGVGGHHGPVGQRVGQYESTPIAHRRRPPAALDMRTVRARRTRIRWSPAAVERGRSSRHRGAATARRAPDTFRPRVHPTPAGTIKTIRPAKMAIAPASGRAPHGSPVQYVR